MKKSGKKFWPFAVLGISVIVLLFVFVAFVIKSTDTDDAGTVAETETVLAELNSDAGDSAEGRDVDNLSGAESEEGSSAEDVSIGEENQETASDAESSVEEVTVEADSISEETSATENQDGNSSENKSAVDEAESASSDEASSQDEQVEDSADTSSTDEAQAENSTDASSSTDEAQAENSTDVASTEASTEAPAPTPHTGGHLVVIDPGHQSSGMSEKEPNGPGSSTMKAKVTGGTSGRTTGLPEYQLALTIGLKLRDELQNRGYTVVMTRESNDVQLSNVDRAQIANNAGAEAFIRIHANGSDDTSVNGAMTICQTPSNPYNAAFYSQSRKLSDCVLDAFVASTGCKKQYVWETDTMTGINWANVPSTIIEMGYMSNPTEDSNMASEAYQQQMVIGMANGIDNFFAR